MWELELILLQIIRFKNITESNIKKNLTEKKTYKRIYKMQRIKYRKASGVV